MKKVCKNCKFYRTTKKKEYYGECRSNKINYSYTPHEENEASYMDFEVYNADFFVGCKFGCIHFKSKFLKKKNEKLSKI